MPASHVWRLSRPFCLLQTPSSLLFPVHSLTDLYQQPFLSFVAFPSSDIIGRPRTIKCVFQSTEFDIAFNQNFCDSSELTTKTDFKTWQVGGEKKIWCNVGA